MTRALTLTLLVLAAVKVGYEVWFSDHGCRTTCHRNDPYGPWQR